VSASRRVRNPFTYGDLVSDEQFTDRADELGQLKSDLRNGQNVAVIAPRRYGKSSLVKAVLSGLLAEGILVVEVDLMTTPTKERFAAKLAKSIHDDVASVVFKAKELGLAGATVLRGAMGFGANSRVHTGKLVEVSGDMPILIEIVDTAQKVESLLPFLDECVTEGMITIEAVKVLRYRHNPAKARR